MSRINALAIIACSLLLMVTACGKPEIGKYHPDEVITVVDSTPLLTLPPSWKKVTSLMKGFPSGIQIYLNQAPVNGKATIAYSLIFDLKANLEIKPVLAAANKKISDFYAEEPGTKYACINGGFFGTNASYSLSIYKGVVDAINIKSLTRPYNNVNTTYYPTRGALGISAGGVPDISWIYHVGTGNGSIYAYPNPASNQLNTAPLSLPSATFPAGGSIWGMETAIGGSPVLIKNANINITDKEELIVVDNNSSRARSAIGFTRDHKIVILAVEGNNSSGGTGLSLAELAQMMKEMGCIGALNLDGGGSTAFVVNGKQTVKPSDGAERGVMTAIIIKEQ
jgi:hypothetical protein